MFASLERLIGWVGVVPLLLWGCAGSVAISNQYEGVCEAGHTRCLADQCTGLKDGRDCALQCDFDARLCQRDQRGTVVAGRRLSDDRALLVDLVGKGIRHSSAVRIKLNGSVAEVDGAHQFMPGASLQAAFDLPKDTRFAELHLLHAPGGSNCFITVTVGDQTLLGRYSPPRVGPGELRRETWDLGKYLDVGGPAQTIKIFLFNNKPGGSKDVYTLSGIELYYRAIEEREAPLQ
jgi:hypothetical protein